ncbi:MAG: hypothetical protein AAF742_03285, partial [Pseudomonadota bacterium]
MTMGVCAGAYVAPNDTILSFELRSTTGLDGVFTHLRSMKPDNTPYILRSLPVLVAHITLFC